MEMKIKRIAKDLLAKGKVDAIIGYRQGSLAHMTEPFLARTAQDAEQLVFNTNCRMNLAVYLTPELFKTHKKVAVTAKGCDSRNMVTQIQENRYSRDQVYIIGLPCTGMADKTKAAAGLTGEDTLQDNCRTCISRNPVISDIMAGKPVAELSLDESRFEDVAALEAMTPEAKEIHFKEMLSACTRCYACRNACPLCYCPTCFVDESRPQWVGKTVAPTDVMTYHLVRAFHDAGRCTDCGACEAACPMDIPVRTFTRKTIKDAKTAYGWETGMDLSLRPPLDRFDLKDPEDFIM
ncbi:MAG: 4Fe-4S dicluster domain-containing protein [Desulfobacter sp.]|nr:MAG: 4Fe-4S dicluster domain-containing protein [Desulfobacter sp.]